MLALAKKTKSKYLCEITTFVAGAIGMIIELVASRILSPYLGSSNLIWTCIIGMMLAFMSLGYFIGGKISDKHPKRDILSLFLLNVAIFTSLIPILEINIIEPLSKTKLDLAVIAIISSTLTFGIPSMFLASASPFAVKLKEKDIEEIGQVSGKMSACSTAGSIIGTFLAGFFLIPKLGVKNIILLITIILIILSFIVHEEKNIKYIIKTSIIALVLIAIVFIGKAAFFRAHKNIILDTDSQYSRIWIKKFKTKNGKEYNTLEVDLGVESISTGDNTLFSDYYLRYYDLFNYYKKDTTDVLLIGGAAYIYPTYFLEKYPDKQIDVVEIDPKMTELAQKYFGLDITKEKLKIYHQDGRRYLNTTNKKYDCILIDAFKGINAPFQLTTKEALENAKKDLKENGIIITNIVSALEGDKSEFIKKEYATYQKVFKHVRIYQAQQGLFNDDEIQNLIIVGFKGDIEENQETYETYKELLQKELTQYKTKENYVTDDLCSIGI